MRLFLSLPLSPVVLDALIAVQEQLVAVVGKEHLKLVKPTDFHCTLLSLGDRDAGQWEGVVDASVVVADSGHPFDVRISGVKSFPKVGPSRTVLCPLVGDGLAEWQKLIGVAEPWFIPMGVPKSGGLQPHITLARVSPKGDGAHVAASLAGLSLDVSCLVDCIELVETFLEPTGARHEVRMQFPLGGGA
ncbi:MAG: 2'-5' RNA ligase family protein [Armatimonadota bacterium]